MKIHRVYLYTLYAVYIRKCDTVKMTKFDRELQLY